jgi:hypothetical protein
MRTKGGRVSVELARKRERVAFELSATKGLTETQIAEELAKQGLGEVTQQAVSKMLHRVEERMLQEMSDKVKTKKIRHEAALMKIYHDAMAAWEESKKPQKSLTTKQGPPGENGESGKVKESLSVLRDQDGDPRYLEQARQALADIRRIWGVDEPTSIKSDLGGAMVLQITEHEVTTDHGDDSPQADQPAPGPETIPTE